MMSDKDSPPPYPGGPSVTVGDMPPVDKTSAGDDSEMKQVWKFIYIDMTYIKSIPGIIQAAELVKY